MFNNTAIENTGLDNHTSNTAGRIVNKNGLPNIIKTGLPWYKRISSFHTLINLSLGKYLALIFIVYSIINFVFASIYFVIGANGLGLPQNTNNTFKLFTDCFFFSAQTLTTVGYGRLSPHTLPANIISSMESLIGLLLFAVITGLSYARFAKPNSHIQFSNNILLSPHKNGIALMLRLVSTKNNILTDGEAKVTAAIPKIKDGKLIKDYFSLDLEISKINSIPFNWTLVHTINADSPFANYTYQDFITNNVEILVFVKAYDEQHSNQVLARTSYTANEFINNAKFKLMFKASPDNLHTILQLNKLNDYELL